MSFFDWDKKTNKKKKHDIHEYLTLSSQSGLTQILSQTYMTLPDFIYIYMVFYLIIYISDDLSTVYNSSEATPVHYHLM